MGNIRQAIVRPEGLPREEDHMNRRTVKQAWWPGRVARGLGLSAMVMAIALIAALAAEARARSGSRDINLKDKSWGIAVGAIVWDIGHINVAGGMHAGKKNASLWLYWEAVDGPHNELIQSAERGRQVNFRREFSFIGGPSKITLTLCDRTKGKGCGSHQRF